MARYSIQDQTFNEGVQSSTLDMAGDESAAQGAQKASQLKWDRKKKRFAASGQVGSDNKKMIRSESGRLLPATYNSGRFNEWRAQRKRVKPADPQTSDAGTNAGKSEILSARAVHRGRVEKQKVSLFRDGRC